MTDADSMLAAEYVLGTLALSERRDFERRLAVAPLLKAEVADWQEKLAPIADCIEEIAPSPALWDRIDAALDNLQSGDAMRTGDNVVPFSRPVVRRPSMKPRVAAGVFGAIAASIVAFGLVGNFDGATPRIEQPAVRTIAPSTSAGQSATRTATAVPCPNDPRNAVQTASGSREPAAQNGLATQGAPASGSVAVASASKGQGAVAVGGQIAVSREQPGGAPEGANNLTTASAAKPESNGNVTTASSPQGNGNVTIASASDPGCK